MRGSGDATEIDRFHAMAARGAETLRHVGDAAAGRIGAVVDACEAAFRSGGRLLFCGNGGSSAESLHLAAEFVVRLRASVDRDALPAIALGGDSVTMSAAANDYGFEHVFARALRAFGRPGDVLFALSTSGRSPNIIAALREARCMTVATVGLLGGDGGDAAQHCDHAFIVPSFETARIQECHLFLGHAIIELVEDRLVAPAGNLSR